jgi:hypothetical protein
MPGAGFGMAGSSGGVVAPQQISIRQRAFKVCRVVERLWSAGAATQAELARLKS